MKSDVDLGLFDIPSLFIVHNNCPVTIGLDEIFNASVYDTFRGVSYVSSPKFFMDIATKFKSTTFIMGIPNSDVLDKFQHTVKTVYMDYSKGVEFFNEMSDEVKNCIVNDTINIRYGKADVMIHDKIYLLSNEDTQQYRVIIGSANLSTAAFNANNKNFENVRIDDDERLYDIYLKRFEEIYKQTNDFIPKRCKKQYKEKKTVIILSADEMSDLLMERLEENRNNIVIEDKYQEKIKNLENKEIKELQEIDITKEVIKATIGQKNKNGIYPIKNKSALQKEKSKIKSVYCNITNEAEQINTRRESIISDSSEYLYKKVGNEAALYSEPASIDDIRKSLENIDRFTNGYCEFSFEHDLKISSKIYEAILYVFTSPFIWRLKQIYNREYNWASVADIPMFLIIGGTSGSGKTNFLRFIARLMGLTDNDLFNYPRELSKGDTLLSLIKTSNLFPIVMDEVSSSFFKRGNNTSKRGEDFIKAVANEIQKTPTGTMVGTTNYTDFNSSAQVIRRIYYLGLNNKFVKDNKEAQILVREIFEASNDKLFRDFSYRFANAIRDNEEVINLDDFMLLTRKIFKQYYGECGMSVPKYFPNKRFFDYEERKKIVWEQIYKYNNIYFEDIGLHLKLDIDRLTNNSVKKKEQLRNHLDDICYDDDMSAGIYWFLHKEKFFKFIEYASDGAEKSVDNISGDGVEDNNEEQEESNMVVEDDNDVEIKPKINEGIWAKIKRIFS